MKLFRISYFAIAILIVFGACNSYKTAFQKSETQNHSGNITSYGPKGIIIKNEIESSSATNDQAADLEKEDAENFSEVPEDAEVVENPRGENVFAKNVASNYKEIQDSYKKNSIARKIFKVNANQNTTQTNADGSAQGGFAIAGFIISIAGLFVFGIIFGLIAMVFSAIGLNGPRKGFAIAGLVIGILDVVLVLIILSA